MRFCKKFVRFSRRHTFADLNLTKQCVALQEKVRTQAHAMAQSAYALRKNNAALKKVCHLSAIRKVGCAEGTQAMY